MILELVDFLAGGLFDLVGFFIGLLPEFTIQDYISADSWVSSDALGWVNWFVPFADMARITAVWIVAVLTYQAYLVWVDFSTKFSQ